MSLEKKLLYFLYSNQNIAGALLGLVGLLLYFLGIVEKHWYFIVPALYLVGVFGIPRKDNFQFQYERNVEGTEQVRRALEMLKSQLKNQLSPQIQMKVEQIVFSIESLLPKLVELDQANRAAFAVRQIALSYLPEALEKYMALPKAYAQFHQQKNGKTAKSVLLDQLEIIDDELNAITNDLLKDDVDGLNAHARFLEDRFKNSDMFDV